MSEERENEVKDTSMQSMMQEEYLKSLDGIEDGQLVTGTVVQVNNETVFVDVGYKSEGRLPLEVILMCISMMISVVEHLFIAC